MVFSTHRFGNLTRHADLILCVRLPHMCVPPTSIDECHRYLNESVILETGTHDELLKREGSDYARLWNIQAQAFL